LIQIGDPETKNEIKKDDFGEWIFDMVVPLL
jgi:hypothetical protein